MKRIINLLLAALMLLAVVPLAGCKLIDKIVDVGPKSTESTSANDIIDVDYGSESVEQLIANAIQLASTCDAQLIKRLIPRGEVEYFVDYYEGKGQDYWKLLQTEFENNKASYDEKCGQDWTITYEITKNNVKDEEGIEKYRDYDNFYFNQYGVDPAKITDVSYIYFNVSVNGSLGSGTKEKSMWVFCYGGRWYSFYVPRFGLNLV